MNQLEDVISHFGGRAKLAKTLGITRAAISFWRVSIPKGRAYQIQILTEGKFKAADLLDIGNSTALGVELNTFSDCTTGNQE